MEKLSIPIAIVVSGILIALALYFSGPKTSNPVVDNNIPTIDSNLEMRPISSSDHILGNPEADIIIVEYSDIECPFCKTFHNTLRRVMDEYGKGGKVAWVYRHFPIDQLHTKARKEAEATECANEIGGNAKFWEYINALYDKTNSNNSLDLAELPKIASAVGLDVELFESCLSSGKYAEKVEADYQDAIRAGGRGTPNSIILSKDGTKTPIQGAMPYDSLKNIIDALLK